MKTSRALSALFVAVLSLGFIGHSPVNPSSERHVSSVCDPDAPTTINAPAAPYDFTALMKTLKPASSINYQDSFWQFQQQIALMQAMYTPLTLPAFFGNYGSLMKADVSLPPVFTPDAAHVTFGGLTTNPSLQFLMKPDATASNWIAPSVPAAQAPGISAPDSSPSGLEVVPGKVIAPSASATVSANALLN